MAHPHPYAPRFGRKSKARHEGSNSMHENGTAGSIQFNSVDGPSFFPHSQSVYINGGNFTNVGGDFINTMLAGRQSDLRDIRLGDLNLLRVIQYEYLGPTGVRINRVRAGTAHRMVATRRTVYQARVTGGTENLTAAVYDGPEHMKTLSHDINKYLNMRHPNVLQIHGIVKSQGLSAVVFHDDLVPLEEVRDFHRQLTISHMYFWYSAGLDIRVGIDHCRCENLGCHTIHQDATDYLKCVIGWLPLYYEMTYWIRRSTGRLCVELADSLGFDLPPWSRRSIGSPRLSLLYSPGSQQESALISQLSLHDMDILLRNYLPWNTSSLDVEAGAQIPLHSVLAREDPTVGIAYLPECLLDDQPSEWDSRGLGMGTVIANGCTRFLWVNQPDGWIYGSMSLENIISVWLLQVNYVFHQLGIPSSSAADYLLPHYFEYHISIKSMTDEFTLRHTFMAEGPDLPDEVYIFVRPWDISQVGDRATLAIPSNGGAYWSLDPEGVDSLDEDEVEALGLPQLKFMATAWFCEWNEAQYESFRQFYMAKGFNPDTTDLARHLNHPLFVINEDIVEAGVVSKDFSVETPVAGGTVVEPLDQPEAETVTSPQAAAESSSTNLVMQERKTLLGMLKAITIVVASLAFLLVVFLLLAVGLVIYDGGALYVEL